MNSMKIYADTFLAGLESEMLIIVPACHARAVGRLCESVPLDA